jgi:hypothetical protein
MVFNMFKGLSRLLSRKSVKTDAPPVVGLQSAESQQQTDAMNAAELSHDDDGKVFIDRQTLIVRDGKDSIVVEWWNGSATIHTTYVDSAALKRMLRYEYLLSTVALNTSVTFNNIGTGLNRSATVNGLVDCLVHDGVLVRIGNTITLATGVNAV